MRVLIVYTGKNGSTKRAAELLAKEFGHVDLADLFKEQPDPDRYDLLIVGSAIRYGRVMKPVRTYLVRNWDKIRNKRKALFICNAGMEQAPRIFQSNYTPELLGSSITSQSFGGELDPDKLKGLDRWVGLMYANRNRDGLGRKKQLPSLKEDRIKAFASLVKEAMHPDQS